MFPKDAEYPMTAAADKLYAGRFHPAAESYAAAKRALAQLTEWFRTQHGAAFSSVLPGNFFGAYGDFDPASAPLVNALIARAVDAKASGSTSPLAVMGTGNPERQIMHAADLARACVWALFNYDDAEPLIVAGEEVSVRKAAELVCEATGFAGGLAFETDAVDGPLKRTADASKFAALCPDFKFKPLIEGMKATAEWYRARKAGVMATVQVGGVVKVGVAVPAVPAAGVNAIA